MYLEPTRNERDYLYGRLLALADRFENGVLYKQGISDTRPPVCFASSRRQCNVFSIGCMRFQNLLAMLLERHIP